MPGIDFLEPIELPDPDEPNVDELERELDAFFFGEGEAAGEPAPSSSNRPKHTIDFDNPFFEAETGLRVPTGDLQTIAAEGISESAPRTTGGLSAEGPEFETRALTLKELLEIGREEGLTDDQIGTMMIPALKPEAQQAVLGRISAGHRPAEAFNTVMGEGVVQPSFFGDPVELLVGGSFGAIMAKRAGLPLMQVLRQTLRDAAGNFTFGATDIGRVAAKAASNRRAFNILQKISKATEGGRVAINPESIGGVDFVRVAVDDEAFARINWEDDVATLTGMSVDPAAKGERLGEDLVMAAAAKAEFDERVLGMAPKGLQLADERAISAADTLKKEGFLTARKVGEGKRVKLTPAGRDAIKDTDLASAGITMPTPRLAELSRSEAMRDILRRAEKLDVKAISARGVVTNAETFAQAAKSNLTLDNILTTAPGSALGPADFARAQALRDAVKSELFQAVKDASDGKISTDVVADLTALYGFTDRRVRGFASETGRALQLSRENIASVPQIRAVSKSIAEISQALRTAIDPERLTAMLSGMSESQVDQFARNASLWGRAAMELLYGTLLGFKSMVRNLGGNTLFFGKTIVQRLVASGMPAERAQVLGAEAGEAVIGAWRAKNIAAKAYGEAVRTGRSRFGSTKFETNLEPAITNELFNLSDATLLGRAVNVGGRALRFIPRQMLGADEFNKVINFEAERFALIYREAVRRAGPRGSAAKVEKIMRRLHDETPRNILREAFEAANERTFTKDFTGRMAAFQNAMGHPLTRWTAFPFFRTMARLSEESIKMVPVGARVLPGVRQMLRAGGAPTQMTRANQAVGGMLIGMAYIMEQNGLLTGAPPKDSSQRAAAEGYGIGWNSIWNPLTQRYENIEGMEPTTTLLKLSATFSRMTREMQIRGVPTESREFGAMAAALLLSTGDAFLNRSFMQTSVDLLEALEPGKDVGFTIRFLQNRLASMTSPAVLREISQAMDNRRKNVESTWDAITARWPLLSNSVLPRRNILTGEPLTYEPGVRLLLPGTEYFSPFFVSKLSDDPVLKELAKLDGAEIRPLKPVVFGKSPSRTGVLPEDPFEGVPLTQQEYDRLLIQQTQKARDPAGRTMHQRMAHEIGKPNTPARKRWDGFTREVKERRLRQIYEKFAAKARGVLMKDPDIRRRLDEKIGKRRGALKGPEVEQPSVLLPR